MAEQTEDAIEIEAEPADVLEVIADFESYPEWSDVESTEVLERDGGGRGTAVAYRISMMGLTAAYTLEYTYTDDGVTWTTREADGAVKDIEGAYVLEETGDGTHVTYRLSVELAVAVPGMLKRRGEKKVVKTALEGLKRRVEEG